jgi:hypothetical protein
MKLIKKKGIFRALTIVAIMALTSISYRVAYHSGFIARARVVHYERDAQDITFAEAKPCTGTYDPYVTRVNTIPSKTR